MTNHENISPDPIVTNFRLMDGGKIVKTPQHTWGFERTLDVPNVATISAGIYESTNPNRLYVDARALAIEQPFSLFIYNPDISALSMSPIRGDRSGYGEKDFGIERYNFVHFGVENLLHFVYSHEFDELISRPAFDELFLPNKNSVIPGVFVSLAYNFKDAQRPRQNDIVIAQMLMPAMEALATDRLRQKDSQDLPSSASPEQPSSGLFPWLHLDNL